MPVTAFAALAGPFDIRSLRLQENDRITSGPAQPVWPIQRPKTVSDGNELCRLTTTTNNAGPRQQATSTRRIGHWASSLTSSKR